MGLAQACPNNTCVCSVCVCVWKEGNAWRGGVERLERKRGRQEEGRKWEEKCRREERNPVSYIRGASSTQPKHIHIAYKVS